MTRPFGAQAGEIASVDVVLALRRREAREQTQRVRWWQRFLRRAHEAAAGNPPKVGGMERG